MDTVNNFSGVPRELFYEYLKNLRDSGKTNMMAAAPYLEMQFGVEHNVAKSMLVDWLKNYKGN